MARRGAGATASKRQFAAANPYNNAKKGPLAGSRRVAEFREIVVKVVSMLSERKITVTQRGIDAYVKCRQDGSVEVLNLPYIPDDATEEFLSAIRGFLDHEVAHILFTDFAGHLKAMKPYKNDAEGKMIHGLYNILEDTRIERKMRQRFPGASANMSFMTRFIADRLQKPGVEAGKAAGDVGAIVNHGIGPLLYAWSGDDESQRIINELDLENLIPAQVAALEPFRKRVPLLETTEDADALAIEIYGKLKQASAPPPPPPPACSKPSEEQGEGEADSDDQSEGQSGKDQAPSKPKDSKKGEPKKEEPKEEPKEDEGEGKGDQKEDASAEESAGEGKGEGEDDADAEGDDEQEDSGKENQDKPDEDQADAEANVEPEQDEGEGEDQGDADAEPDQGDEGEGDEGEGEGKGEGDGESDDQAENEGDAADGQSDGKPSSSPAPAGNQELPEDQDGAEDDQEARDVAISLLDGLGMGSAGNDNANVISVLSLQSLSHDTYLPYSTEFDSVEHPKWDPAHEPMIDQAIIDVENRLRSMIGAMQGQMRRLFAQQDQLAIQGGLRSGRLDAGNLYRLRTGDDRVFSRREETHAVNTAVSLVIDCSGSMSGEKIKLACESAYALSQTLDRLGIVHEITGFTTYDGGDKFTMGAYNDALKQQAKMGRSFSRLSPIRFYVFKEFDERTSINTKRRIVSASGTGRGSYNRMRPSIKMGANVDGESILMAANRLKKRREPRKIMIVLSDGQPAGGGGKEDHLHSHLIAAVKECEKAHIETVGIGIQDESVKHYYPKHVILSDIEKLPQVVVSQLKTFLVDKRSA